MDNINNDELGYNLKISDMMKKSNRISWAISFFSLLVAAGSLFLYIYHPLTKTIPYVIKVNNDGIPTLMTSLDKKNIEVDEAVDKYFIKEYIERREQYFWNLLEKDYLFTGLLSSASVYKVYKEQYEGLKSRDKRLKDTVEVSIHIKSIVLGENAGIKNATVRIEKITTSKATLEVVKNEKLIVTMAYRYDGSLELSEKDRLEDPLGFMVETYKIDEEIE